MIWHTEEPDDLFERLDRQEGYDRALVYWHDAINWFDNQGFNADDPPPIPADTTVSGYTLRWQGPGYGVAPDCRDDDYCPRCYGNPCECHHPPPDPTYAAYLEVWHSGAFDAEDQDAVDAAEERDALVEAGLLGYREDLGYVGYEALLNGGAW